MSWARDYLINSGASAKRHLARLTNQQTTNQPTIKVIYRYELLVKGKSFIALLENIFDSVVLHKKLSPNFPLFLETVGVKDGMNDVELAYFSATCWYYGIHLYDKLKYPIGLVASSWSGSPIEYWSSPEALEKCHKTQNDTRIDEWVNTWYLRLTNRAWGLYWWKIGQMFVNCFPAASVFNLGPYDLRGQLERLHPMNKRILHKKQREWAIFTLQSILNNVTVVHTTAPRPFSRLKEDVSSRSEKSCYLRLNSIRHYGRFRRTGAFRSHKTNYKCQAR